MNKRPDLIVLVAVWEFISAAGILIPIAGLAGMLWFMPWGVHMGGWWGGWNGGVAAPGIAITVLSILVFVWVAYGGLAVAGGIGLLQGREWGRIMSIIHAALSLFWFPVGTVIGILVLVYLVKPEVREYFESGGK
jgi:hypothetical protein